jgi:ABC-type polysaccharide/polyol phosphate transport system ATPase subunit
MPEPAISVRNVTKSFRLFHEKNSTLKATVMRGRRARYEEFLALDDVSFDVPVGATFGLIGENGSGKSTLLKCMARILLPNEGTIQMTGQVSALLELGAGFHGELSGRENVYLNGSILGLSKREIDRRFDDIVEFAGGEVPRFIDNPVKNYSSGMFVRLGFAIAINVEPDTLLVDEILAVGDEDFQRKCMSKFADFRKDGRTVVIVSHSLDTVRSLCDEAAWLEHGKLKFVGPSGKVVDRYLDMVTGHQKEEAARTTIKNTRHGRRLKEIELLGPEGQPRRQLHSGEPATIRITVDCDDSQPGDALRLEVNQEDGTSASQVSTRGTEVTLHELHGTHLVDYRIPRLLLAPRDYDLTVVLVRRDGRTDVERLREAIRFQVVPGRDKHRGGYMLLGGEWGEAPPTAGLTGGPTSD